MNMGTSYETAAPPLGEGLTFEKVWIALMELRNFQKESDRRMEARSAEIDRLFQETDRIVKETAQQMKETDRRQQETDRIVKENAEQLKETDRQMKETAQQMKETDRQLGKLGNRFGEMVEYMVVPNLVAKFQELDFTFTRASRDVKIADKEHQLFMEIDAFMENGDKVMIVEIKTKPDINDINDHLDRMKKLRRYADLHRDRRGYLGAMAGMVFDDSVKNYALKNGFYVLEPSGETFTVTDPKDKGYTAQEW
jgi:hypothetical protein